jgi:hypothetical protein
MFATWILVQGIFHEQRDAERLPENVNGYHFILSVRNVIKTPIARLMKRLAHFNSVQYFTGI